MIAKQKRPPKTQRAFRDSWLELAYLCEKIHYWLYVRKQRNRAERYLTRLKAVLQKVPRDDVAILRQEGLALLHELQGDLEKSIAYRSREVELIERLHEIAKEHDADVAAYMLRGRGLAALHERRCILERLQAVGRALPRGKSR